MPSSWPLAADPSAGERLVERFAGAGRGEAMLAKRPPVRAMLLSLGGNSPYLADLAVREAETLGFYARRGPEAAAARAMAALAQVRPQRDAAEIASALRAAKRQVALAVGVADIGGSWTLDQVVAAISALAEATLGLTVAHLLCAAQANGDVRLRFPADPARGCGFTVLGMGKLGAGELNYSSDIDLILIHDPDDTVYTGDEPVAFFTRIARGIVNLMETRDANGYVFRTDFRLRPDPAATPPSIAVQAAAAYYASMGQNWERAAMLKARPVAGDLALGAQFLDEIRPFVWRRHADFAAVADIHAMKRRIDDHKGTNLNETKPGRRPNAVARVLGHNVKLGQGGIREIEFLVQTLQLVWGGRDPSLRAPRTLDALRVLAGAGHLPRRTATALDNAYRFLRRVEHRLQMVADRQTHLLPGDAARFQDFALFMGFATGQAFAAVLMRHIGRVQDGYSGLFGTAPPTDATAVGGLDFDGADARTETLAALGAMGFAAPAAAVAAVQGWKAGRVRALRSRRAQELMDQLLPGLLAALSRQTQPDAALARFDTLIGRLPAGVQLLSLFQRNPRLLDRIVAVLGASPSLADHLARTPSALEGLLAPDGPTDHAAVLRARLADARTLEDAIAIVRSAVREEAFAISVATLEGRLDADGAGLARTRLADAALATLLTHTLADFTARHGKVQGGAMAVVLLGKAGGREMMAGSDLDLMIVYDHPAQVADSTPPPGGRQLAASQWFIRAVHAYVAAITAPDAEGPLYAVDMRLRPSGNKGPVAVSLASFENYHAEHPHDDGRGLGAWTWERMALTRARVIAGPARLRARIEATIRAAPAAAGPPGRVAADAVAMRARLSRDLPPAGPWDVKLRLGGQIDVEFIAQALQLMHAGRHPGVLQQTTRLALAALREAGVLAPADAGLLIRADLIWRSLQGLLRIAYGRVPAAGLSPASAEALVRAVGRAGGSTDADATIDLAALRVTLDTLAEQVRDAFSRILGDKAVGDRAT